MTARFEIKGRCPGALLPMASGDGLVVRIRPKAGALSRLEAQALAQAALRYGNGQVELTSRANLQLRGVAVHDHPPMIAMLSDAGLLDEDAESEGRRNIVMTPFGEGAARARAIAIVHALEAQLACIDGLPAKFGFAVDIGSSRVLTDTPADVRIERQEAGSLIVRADGLEAGVPVPYVSNRNEAEAAADVAAQLARWFVESGGARDGRGRMAGHVATGIRPPAYAMALGAPAPPSNPTAPGPVAEGVVVAVEFGQLPATVLNALAKTTVEVRITPWRMMLLVGVEEVLEFENLICAGSDPRLRVTACTGAPGCPQAHAQTRTLARALAQHVSEDAHLHVSGCRKGCAMAKPAPFTLVADEDGFMIVKNGNACAAPVRRGLAAERLIEDPSILFGAP